MMQQALLSSASTLEAWTDLSHAYWSAIFSCGIAQRKRRLLEGVGVSSSAGVGKVVEKVVASGYFSPELSNVLFKGQGPVKGDAGVH